MSEKLKPGDKVRVTTPAEYRENMGGFGHWVRIDGKEIDLPADATVELIERADDPSRDPSGTVRTLDGEAYVRIQPGSAIVSEIYTWLEVATGGANTCGVMEGSAIIGAVPGTPAWDVWLSGELRGAPRAPGQPVPLSEIFPDELTPEQDKAMRKGYETQCDCSAHEERPLWTGDGSEEPPPYVTKVRRKDGRTITRHRDGWNYAAIPQSTPWPWDVEMVRIGPYTEVRGD
jgi:hypothetical protein